MENMNADNIFWNIYLIVEDIKDAKAAAFKRVVTFKCLQNNCSFLLIE